MKLVQRKLNCEGKFVSKLKRKKDSHFALLEKSESINVVGKVRKCFTDLRMFKLKIKVNNCNGEMEKRKRIAYSDI
jgi:hypothetical protein